MNQRQTSPGVDEAVDAMDDVEMQPVQQDADKLRRRAASPGSLEHGPEPAKPHWTAHWQIWAKIAVTIYMLRAALEAVAGMALHPFRRKALAETPALHGQATQLNRFLVDSCPSLKTFQPTPWAPGPISQTVLGLLVHSGSEEYDRRTLIEAPDGVELLVDWKEDDGLPPDAPILFILHGIGGGSSSRLACHLSDEVKRHGWRAAVYNRRGHGQSSLLPGPIAPLRLTPGPQKTEKRTGNGIATPLALLKDVLPSNVVINVAAAATSAAAAMKDLIVRTSTANGASGAVPAHAPGSTSAPGALVTHHNAAAPATDVAVAGVAVGAVGAQSGVKGRAKAAAVAAVQVRGGGGGKAREGGEKLDAVGVAVVDAETGEAATDGSSAGGAGSACDAMQVDDQPGQCSSGGSGVGPHGDSDVGEGHAPYLPLRLHSRGGGSTVPHTEQQQHYQSRDAVGATADTAVAAAAAAAAAVAAVVAATAAATSTGAGTCAPTDAHADSGPGNPSQTSAPPGPGQSHAGVQGQAAVPPWGPGFSARVRTSGPGVRSASKRGSPESPEASGGGGGMVGGGYVQPPAKLRRMSSLAQVQKLFPRHSDTDDLAQVVAWMQAAYPHAPKVALGFSQGSNALVHYLGLHASDPPPFIAAMSIANAYDLNIGVNALRKDWVSDAIVARPIKALLRKELAAVKQLADAHGITLDLDRALTAHSIKDVDEALCPAWGFTNVTDYYAQQSSREVLQDVRLPLLLVNNRDDPIIHDALPHIAEAAANANPWLLALCTDRGGHLGWMQGWSGASWIGQLMMEYAKAAMAAARQGLVGPAGLQPPAPGAHGMH